MRHSCPSNGTVTKEAVYIAGGIRKDGPKEVLAYTVTLTESAYVWKELIEDIQTRGVAEVLLFISDGLAGIKDSIHSVFPKAKYQTCFIHVARNIAHKVRVSDRKVTCEDLKSLYRATGKAKAEQALETFVEKWKKSYTKVTTSLKENPNLFTFYDFLQAIRRSIYSTNLIDSFNKQTKRYSRRRGRPQMRTPLIVFWSLNLKHTTNVLGYGAILVLVRPVQN